MRISCLTACLFLGVSLGAQRRDVVRLQDGSEQTGRLAEPLHHEVEPYVLIRTAEGPATVALQRVESVTTRNGDRYEVVDLLQKMYGRPPSPASSVFRAGRVLARGDVGLLRVALASDEYDPYAAGDRPYGYVLRWKDSDFWLGLTTIEVYERMHANPSRFRNVLAYLTRDCADARALARRAGFQDAAILEVLQAYQECHPEVSLEVVKKHTRGVFGIEHILQLAHVDTRDADFSDGELSAGLGYQAIGRFRNRYRRLAVLAGAQYLYRSFRWQQTTEISQGMVRGNLSLGFTAVERPKFMLMLSGGLSNYNAVTSGLRSFFSNNYFLLNGGVQLGTGNWRIGLHYEHLPHQISRRPANQLLTTVGYRIAG